MKPTKGIFTASGLAALVGTVLMGILSPDVTSAQFTGFVLTYTFVGSFFAVICALLFGWPLSIIYTRLGMLNWWQYCVGGILCALPFWVIWFYPFNTGHWQAYRISNSIYFFGVGMLGGYFYWWLVVKAQLTNKANHSRFARTR